MAGHNVAIEYRFSEGRDERLPQIAADLVGQSVSMLIATDRPSAMAAKAATATIPIVFTSGLDPVQIGLVASFNRRRQCHRRELVHNRTGAKTSGAFTRAVAETGHDCLCCQPK